MIDILYLGVNMGNAGYRFFPRYPEAKQDYYTTFKWLVALQSQYPDLNIAIKHHSGDYNCEIDKQEMDITKGITYIDKQFDSYLIAEDAKMCVSYCSTMILEMNYPNLAQFIYRQRHKRFNIRRKCKGYINRIPIYHTHSYYLNPRRRNRQFCAYIDDVCIHNCSKCKNPPYLEIYEPYQITSYEAFKEKVKEIIDK